MRTILVIVVAFASGCLRTTEFHCETSDQCGAGGTCQSSVGFCSFADPDCGQRFGPQAGMYAGQCVTPEQQIDAAIDTNMQIDGSTAQCPVGYAAIPMGQPGHKYMLITTPAAWMAQVTACDGTSTHLAWPQDAMELKGLDNYAGSASAIWLGISDLTTPDVWMTVKNTTPPFLPWKPPAPNKMNGNEDCVLAITAMDKLSNDVCSGGLPAICECE